MKKRIVHIFISFFLLLVFQTPVWIQLEHTVHKHTNEANTTCDRHDLENHIHLNKKGACFLFHRPVNSVLQFHFIDYQNVTVKKSIEISDKLDLSPLKQLIRYANLRAPPRSI